MPDVVLLRVPRDAWETLSETLAMDTQSNAFDSELQREINDALEQVDEVDTDETYEACRTAIGIIETHIGGGFIKDGSWADVLSEFERGNKPTRRKTNMLTHTQNVEELAAGLQDEDHLPAVVLVDDDNHVYEITDVRTEYMDTSRVIVEIEPTGNTLDD